VSACGEQVDCSLVCSISWSAGLCFYDISRFHGISF
jgi:hypothetical protein